MYFFLGLALFVRAHTHTISDIFFPCFGRGNGLAVLHFVPFSTKEEFKVVLDACHSDAMGTVDDEAVGETLVGFEWSKLRTAVDGKTHAVYFGHGGGRRPTCAFFERLAISVQKEYMSEHQDARGEDDAHLFDLQHYDPLTSATEQLEKEEDETKEVEAGISDHDDGTDRKVCAADRLVELQWREQAAWAQWLAAAVALQGAKARLIHTASSYAASLAHLILSSS